MSRTRTQPAAFLAALNAANVGGRIERLARSADVPVSALIRGWVLAGLAEDREATLASAVERLAADVDRVRRLAAG